MPPEVQGVEGEQTLRLHVSSTGDDGSVLISKGEDDGLATGDSILFRPRIVVVIDPEGADGMTPGDRVLLHPQEDTEYQGTVTEISKRTARVTMTMTSYVPAPGSRGIAVIPGDRVILEREDSSDDDWGYEDDPWSPGMPLLAQVKPVRPEERGMQISGRYYLSADLNLTTVRSQSDTFVRAGTDLRVENPLGKGGALRFDGEINFRSEEDRQERDEDDLDFRLDRLSYAIGGTRFSPQRWEIGRFLQYGMPEFGLLDGVEYVRRRENGDRFGASLGYLPEPDGNQKTGDDLAVSIFYEYVADDAEEFTFGAGFQKTFHDAKRDRDLLVTKLRYLPAEGWDFNGTVWVDFYTNSDRAKDSDVEITQAYLSSSRTWSSGRGIDIGYRRVRFPELLRREFTPITLRALAKNHYDRIWASFFSWATDRHRIHGEVGAFTDEDESGGDGEFGIETRDIFFKDSLTDVTIFGGKSPFETLLGGRASLGHSYDGGRWNLIYEIADHDWQHFSENRNDLLQHRLRGELDLYFESSLTLSFYGQGSFFDDDQLLSLGFFLQKSF